MCNRLQNLKIIYMKPSLFRLPKLDQARTENQVVLFKELADQVGRLSLAINKLSKNYESSCLQNCEESEFQIEARDKRVLLDLPSSKDTAFSSRKATIKKWIAGVMKYVVSSSFYWYSKSEMTFNQAKVFCAENILLNLKQLDDQWKLTSQEIKQIDQFMEGDLLSYAASKYPLSESNEVSKKLQQAVREIDNLDALRNDYFYTSSIQFSYRESGNYNDLIMRVLNDLMQRIDLVEEGDTLSPYKSFEAEMTSFFQKLDNEQWMNQGQSGTNKGESTAGDKKYKEHVRQYTHYLIGRKFSENTKLYSQQEIESCHLQIRSPQVLRILTKWCEELWSKFTILNYYYQSLGQFLLINGKAVNLSSQLRNALDNSLQKEKSNILSFLESLKTNNYLLQSQILKLNSLPNEEAVNNLEGVCGKYSVKVLRNLHVYIVSYLNKLIHTLCFISKDLYNYYELEQTKKWTSPPNLLTLRLGDIMRCKCSSKQTEILKLYQQLGRMSRQQPDKVKIVRVKNRLRKGTNDILINIRFKNRYLCQMQLSIKPKVTQFANRANQYAHFLYQLQRTLFGPLTELCSIWNALDGRSTIYERMVRKQRPALMQQHKKCSDKIEMLPYNFPFICSSCGLHYSHDNYIFSHLKCINCSYFQCCVCYIKTQQKEGLLAKLAAKHEILSNCYDRMQYGQYFAEFGVCLNVQSKLVKPEFFQHIYYDKRQYLLGQSNGNIYQISQIDTQDQKQKLFSKYLVLYVPRDLQSSIFKLDFSSLLKKYVLPKTIKLNYAKQKESINLEEKELQQSDCAAILRLGTQIQRANIVSLFLNNNCLLSIGFVAQLFANLQWIQINQNQIEDIAPLCSISGLAKVFAQKNQIENIPSDIRNLVNLEQLILDDNQLTILPKEGVLPKLRMLNVRSNQIYLIEDGFCDCPALSTLDLAHNQLSSLPSCFGSLIKLSYLDLSENNLSAFPTSFKTLQKLLELKVSQNQFVSVPEEITKLANLQLLQFNQNKLSEIPNSIGRLTKLRELYLIQNQLTQLPDSMKHLFNLNLLLLNDNKFKAFPEAICSLAGLKGLVCNNNTIPTLPAQFTQLANLNYLEITRCNLASCDFLVFTQLSRIKVINLQFNELTSFPSLKDCKCLKQLRLAFNSIAQLSQDMFQGLEQVEVINLSLNQITILPALGHLPKLKQLKLDLNEISQFRLLDGINLPSLTSLSMNACKYGCIPTFVFRCELLEIVYLAGNNIEDIDQRIRNLKRLRQLYLMENSLKQIPQVIGELNTLQSISFVNNQITTIPAFFDGMDNLKMIYLLDNPIKSLACNSDTASKLDDTTRRIAFEILEAN